MELTSARTVPATPEATWASLNDPDTLKACIPGCESIERISESEFAVAMTARVGPVAAKFTGRIVLADRVAPASYRLTFEGQGGAAGFARGEARVVLVPDGAGTRIEYTATAQVGGKLAQIGSRLIDGAAAKVADDFFACFVARLGGVPRAAALPPVAPATLAVASQTMWLRLALAALLIGGVALYWLSRPG